MVSEPCRARRRLRDPGSYPRAASGEGQGSHLLRAYEFLGRRRLSPGSVTNSEGVRLPDAPPGLPVILRRSPHRTGAGTPAWECRRGLLQLPTAGPSGRERSARWESYQIVSGCILKTHFKRRLELLKFSIKKYKEPSTPSCSRGVNVSLKVF